MGFSRGEAGVGRIGDGESDSSRVAVRQPPTPARRIERRGGGHRRVAEVVGSGFTFEDGEERDATETRR
jgi:hypothetical protein